MKLPIAYSDKIKEACVKLSYAFPYRTEAERQGNQEYWEDKLRFIISQNYDIIEVKS